MTRRNSEEQVMDPNEALKNARLASATVRRMLDQEDLPDLRYAVGDDGVDAIRSLVESFDALDGWLRRDGFLPADWKPRPRS